MTLLGVWVPGICQNFATEFALIIHTLWWGDYWNSFSRTGDMKHSLCVYDHLGEKFEW